MPSAGVVREGRGRRRGDRRGQKAGDGNRQQTADLDHREQVLRTGGGAQAGDVEERERDHDAGGPERARRRAERDAPSTCNRRRRRRAGDRPAVDHRRACPCVQETRVAAERAGQKMVVAACVRIGRGKLGVAERARERHDGAQHPRHDQPADVAGDARHHRRRLEDAGADDDADDDRDRVGGTQQRPRCRPARRGLGNPRPGAARSALAAGDCGLPDVGQRAGHARSRQRSSGRSAACSRCR